MPPLIPKRDPVYRGQLSSALAAQGMTSAMRNAARLLDDARLLARDRRHASATALAVLAIEEMAKADILTGLATWPAEARAFWRMFRNHVDKNSLGFVPLLRSQSRLEGLIWLHENANETYFDDLKWSALYLDLLQGPSGPYWAEPDATVTEEHSNRLIALA